MDTKKLALKKALSRLRLLIVLFGMVVTLALLEKSFLTAGNIENILQQISINVCLSIGLTLVILTGGIDLSVGSMLAFSGMIMASFLKNGIAVESFDVLIQFSFHGALLAGLLTGLLLGLFNGMMITALRIPPFVATLAMLSMARGLTRLWTGGEPITDLGEAMAWVGGGKLLGLPIIIWIPAMLVLVFVVVTRRTRLGRHLYAVGGNERAAILSGLPVRRIKMAAYALSGLLAAVAALILTARVNSATVIAGETYELDAIAAVVIGGTSLSGGRGSVLGTLLGCLIFGVLDNGLNILEVSSNWQLVVKGAVILLAVALDKLRGRE